MRLYETKRADKGLLNKWQTNSCKYKPEFTLMPKSRVDFYLFDQQIMMDLSIHHANIMLRK
jgi:hypothetical protein